jgi:hypothetical protein
MRSSASADALATHVLFFLRKIGLNFIEISDSLHHTPYKDILERKGNYKQVLVRNSRSFSSPVAGGDAKKPTTFPTKNLQSFGMAPRVAPWEIQDVV